MLNRLDEMGSGEVFVAGEPLNGIPPARLRRDVSLLSQRPVMFPGSVIDNVLLPFRLIEARVSSEAVARACTVLIRLIPGPCRGSVASPGP